VTGKVGLRRRKALWRYPPGVVGWRHLLSPMHPAPDICFVEIAFGDEVTDAARSGAAGPCPRACARS